MKNSRRKGARAEREFASLLREHGFDARRGQQFAGSPDSPDVVCDPLAWLRFEVKRVERLDLRGAVAQAEGDSAGKPWAVAHRWNGGHWLMTMDASLFFRLLRGDFPEPITKGTTP
jgi:hypothetical protein